MTDQQPTECTLFTHFGKFQMAVSQQHVIQSTLCMHAHYTSLFSHMMGDWRLAS